MKCACILSGLLLWASVSGVELLKNASLEKNAAHWQNWGGKKGLKLRNVPEGLLVTGTGKGLNQGIAQVLKLEPGCSYRYSCRLKGELAPGAKLTVLSRLFVSTDRRSRFKDVTGDFEWWDFSQDFAVPYNCDGRTVIRPAILTGPGKFVIASVSLKKLSVPPVEKRNYKAFPKVKKVIHQAGVTDLSAEKAVNLNAHINEKPSAPLAGNRVEQKNGKFIIHYKFSSRGHDALMFDLVKEIPSCKKISMEITSAKKKHRLFFVLTDKNGESHLTVKPILISAGRRKVDMTLPLPAASPYNILDSVWGGDGNQRLDLPLKKITVVLDDSPDSSQDSGVITISNLKIGNW